MRADEFAVLSLLDQSPGTVFTAALLLPHLRLRRQRWLRLAGALSLERSTFIAAWREAATELLGVGPGKSLRVLDERWRDWALDMQDTSDDPRRKR